MSRLAACLILLSGSLHAAELNPLVLDAGLTDGNSSRRETNSASDSELLAMVFDETGADPVTVAEPVGTICYEDYCRRCDCRTWTARVGLLAWRPDEEEDDDGGGGLFAITGNQEYDFGFGPYVDLIYHTGAADLEFIFFSVYDWNSNVQIGPLFSFSREAELENYEANIKKEVLPGLRLLTGIRVVELEALGTFNIPGAMPPVTVDIAVDNELIGWQFGVEAEWFRRGPFWVDSTWKGGVYHNDIEASLSVPMVGAVAVEQGETSFLTDFWFNLNYQVSDRLILRGGYSLMYIDSVANLGGVESIDLDGDIFIHGPQVMFEVGI